MKCIGDFGHCEEDGRVRGLCRRCYSTARLRVKSGLTTWEELESLGLASKAAPVRRRIVGGNSFEKQLATRRQAIEASACPPIGDVLLDAATVAETFTADAEAEAAPPAGVVYSDAEEPQLDLAGVDRAPNSDRADGRPKLTKEESASRLRHRTLTAIANQEPEQPMTPDQIDREIHEHDIEATNAALGPQQVVEVSPDPVGNTVEFDGAQVANALAGRLPRKMPAPSAATNAFTAADMTEEAVAAREADEAEDDAYRNEPREG